MSKTEVMRYIIQCMGRKNLHDNLYMDTITSKRRNTNKQKYFYYDSRTKKRKDGSYEVHPVGLTDIQVFICCPLCHEFHVHGRGDGGRVPHCKDSSLKVTYYEIVKSEKEALE